MIVDGDVAPTDDLEPVALHDDGGVLVDTDAEQIRARANHLDQVELAIAPQQVLIDPDAPQQPEPILVIAHHDRVGPRIAAHQVRAQDGRPRRGSTDDADAVEHLAERLVHLRVQVRIGEPPLAPAAEPDATGVTQRLDERVGVRNVAVRRVQDREAGRPGRPKRLGAPPCPVVRLRSACRRDEHDRGVRTAGEIQEALDDGRVLHAPAHEHERSPRGPDLLRGKG